MTKYIPTSLINIFIIILAVLVAFSISTIAITKKVNESNIHVKRGITATVVKQPVPILSLSRGIVIKIHFKTGDEVKKGDLLVQMSNPLLEDKLEVYQQFRDNQSAQTEAGLAKSNINNLNIYAPVDGIVGDIFATEGSSVDEFSKVLTMYSSQDVRILANLTEDQYQAVQNKKEVYVYSKRLGQTFSIIPTILKPDVKAPLEFEEKKIGLYFNFTKSNDGISLLNNEDVELRLENEETATVEKPIDIFVDFWNGLISRPTN